MSRVPVAGPWITDKEIDYVGQAARNGWYGGSNEFIVKFETAFADHLGVRHAVSLPSATSAIHLSLAALDVGPGDEVIVPESTWIATSAPIAYVGATPRFVDVDPSTWCLDVASFEAAITPRTRAVIPVDLYGGMPDMDGIRRVAAEHGIAVIEDAAEAIGSEFGGHPAGSFGDTGIFSFHGSKTLTTGEGGMLVTNQSQVFERIQVLRDHGRLPGDTLFRNVEVAYKYKMSGLQAALGLAQLERIEDLVGRKREIFGWYREQLGALSGVTLNVEPIGTKNSYWMTTVIVDPSYGRTKEQILDHLKHNEIDCRPFFYPLSSLEAYADLADAGSARERNPVSYRLSATGVNLPSALSLTEADVVRVCHVFRGALGLV